MYAGRAPLCGAAAIRESLAYGLIAPVLGADFPLASGRHLRCAQPAGAAWHIWTASV